MDDEIKVPSFVNDRYYASREEKNKSLAQPEKKIEKLKIYPKVIKLIAFGAVLTAVVVESPKIAQGIKDVVNSAIEYDNQQFEQENLKNQSEVEQLTNKSIDEIMDSGKSL